MIFIDRLFKKRAKREQRINDVYAEVEKESAKAQKKIKELNKLLEKDTVAFKIYIATGHKAQ